MSKAGSDYCEQQTESGSVQGAQLFFLRPERGVQGAEMLHQYTRGNLLSHLFLNTDFLRKIKLLTKLHIIVIPSGKHLQLTGVFLLVKLNCSDCPTAIAVQ